MQCSKSSTVKIPFSSRQFVVRTDSPISAVLISSFARSSSALLFTLASGMRVDCHGVPPKFKSPFSEFPRGRARAEVHPAWRHPAATVSRAVVYQFREIRVVSLVGQRTKIPFPRASGHQVARPPLTRPVGNAYTNVAHRAAMLARNDTDPTKGTALDALLRDLTPAQREAVQHVEGPLLILAGPGSGKTRVITHRIAYLLAQGVPRHQILALTFTNKAADEMAQRVERLAPGQPVWVSTFHRFCARLLRQYAPLVGLQENYTIYDADDSRQALRRAIERLKIDVSLYPPDAISAAISWAKNKLISPDEYRPRPGHALGDVVKRIYPPTRSSLAPATPSISTTCCCTWPRCCATTPRSAHQLDERYRFVLVDEYQDTNLAQYAIVRALSIDHPNLAVTGDPDQSIYGWRGANLNNILEFEQDFPNVRVVRLEQNYRSTQANPPRGRRTDRPQRQAQGEGSVHRERRGRAGPAGRLRQPERRGRGRSPDADRRRDPRRPPPRGDFAIFYRVNALSRPFELALREQGIPYQMVNGLEFFQRKEIKDVLAYLQLLNNPRDDIALLRVINTPARGIGKTTHRAAGRPCARHGMTLLEAARACRRIDVAHRPGREADRRSSSPCSTAWPRWPAGRSRKSSATCSTKPATSSSSGTPRARRTSSGWPTSRNCSPSPAISTNAIPATGHLEAFLEETSLVNDTDDWEAKADRVTLMTLHASKGLEFPVVYLVAVEEGLLPHERSREHPDQLEEERRLMFVGITRAKQELQISSPGTAISAASAR